MFILLNARIRTDEAGRRGTLFARGVTSYESYTGRRTASRKRLVRMATYHFTLSIPAEEYVRYYQGQARQVVVETAEGLTLRFPAGNLVKFVTRNGIHGDFCLKCDETNKLIKLERLGGSSNLDSRI